MTILILAALGALTPLAFTQRLPTGREIRPLGQRLELDTFPMRAALVDGKRLALVLHSGFRPASLRLIDLESGRRLAEAPLPDAGVDFAWDARTRRIYVAGGFNAQVLVFQLRGAHPEDATLLPAGSFAGDASGTPLAARPAQIAGVALSADGNTLAALEPHADRITLFDTQGGRVLRRIEQAGRPAHAIFGQDGRSLYVASASESAVVQYHAASGQRMGSQPVAAGPSFLLQHGSRIFVACANSNSVDALEVAPDGRLTPGRRLNLAFTPGYPNGLSPSALAWDEESASLLVSLSDANAIARLRFPKGMASPQIALIPAGWYPTFALPLPRGRLLILNAKGFGSRPNRRGPNPTQHATMTPQPPSDIEYIPLIQGGGGQIVPKLSPQRERDATRTVLRLNHARPDARPKAPLLGGPVPFDGRPSPIRHVIYIMKENRTYDQVLGDLLQGNGDPSLCLFPERITPNHHQLAREFTLFDNFYVNADVSSEGWHWTSAATVPHLVMRHWPAAYAGRTRLLRGGAPATPSSASAEDPFTAPGSGYLWTRALDRGLSVRNFGFFVQNRPRAAVGQEQLESVSDPRLLPYTNRYYAGYNPDFPDVARARIFLEELAVWEKAGQMPRLIVMVLPNDHTWGTAPGKLTPFASMADNDLALGQIVEGVSRSRFWKETAIFVVEDDAQNGPDHVDSHRSLAYVISPYTRRGFVDSAFYNTTSMLRTIELILGLPPLTHYDAFAPPMLTAFQPDPVLTPYRALPANVSLTETNPLRSATAPRSETLNLSVADAIDEREMNDILWLAIRGTPAPPPVDSVFLRGAGFRLQR